VENPTPEGATTDKINLTELREMAEWRSSNAMPADPFKREINSSWGLTAGHLLALIDAVEAADELLEATDRHTEDIQRGLSDVVHASNRNWQQQANTRLREVLARFQP
jgi:hypothetical protein